MSCVFLDTAVAGDVNDVREFVLSGGLPNAELAAALAEVGVTIQGKINGTAATLAGAVVDAATRRVSISLGDETGWLASATPDDGYDLEIVVALVNGTVLTFPSGAPMKLPVRARG